MTIQQYSELIAKVAKIETMAEFKNKLKKKLDEISKEQDKAYNDKADYNTTNELSKRWLLTYDEISKLDRKIKKAHKVLRTTVENSEFSYLASDARHSLDKSDKNFYWCTRYAILKEGKHIEFTTAGK